MDAARKGSKQHRYLAWIELDLSGPLWSRLNSLVCTQFMHWSPMFRPSESRILKLNFFRIFRPWNYPVQLSLVPLIGALAAGNAVYLKLSRHSPNTSACLERLLLASLDRRAVAIESEGGANTITALNHQKWDRTFLTLTKPTKLASV